MPFLSALLTLLALPPLLTLPATDLALPGLLLDLPPLPLPGFDAEAGVALLLPSV